MEIRDGNINILTKFGNVKTEEYFKYENLNGLFRKVECSELKNNALNLNNNEYASFLTQDLVEVVDVTITYYRKKL